MSEGSVVRLRSSTQGEAPLAACSERGGHSEWVRGEGFEGGSMYAEWGGSKGKGEASTPSTSLLLGDGGPTPGMGLTSST